MNNVYLKIYTYLYYFNKCIYIGHNRVFIIVILRLLYYLCVM